MVKHVVKFVETYAYLWIDFPFFRYHVWPLEKSIEKKRINTGSFGTETSWKCVVTSRKPFQPKTFHMHLLLCYLFWAWNFWLDVSNLCGDNCKVESIHKKYLGAFSLLKQYHRLKKISCGFYRVNAWNMGRRRLSACIRSHQTWYVIPKEGPSQLNLLPRNLQQLIALWQLIAILLDLLREIEELIQLGLHQKFIPQKTWPKRFSSHL